MLQYYYLLSIFSNVYYISIMKKQVWNNYYTYHSGFIPSSGAHEFAFIIWKLRLGLRLCDSRAERMGAMGWKMFTLSVWLSEQSSISPSSSQPSRSSSEHPAVGTQPRNICSIKHKALLEADSLSRFTSSLSLLCYGRPSWSPPWHRGHPSQFSLVQQIPRGGGGCRLGPGRHGRGAAGGGLFFFRRGHDYELIQRPF